MAPDAAALALLHARAFPSMRPWTSSEFDALTKEPGAVLVADHTGLGLARVAAGEAEILTLAILPHARGQGRGRSLLSTLEARSAAAGAAEMFLEVAEDNTAARALYAKAGYSAVGRRRAYYAHGADALVLRKTLPPPNARS